MTSQPLGNGEIADILERALTAAARGAQPTDGVMLDALGALAQLRGDRRALQAKERLEGHLRNLPWHKCSDEQLAINAAYIMLNYGNVPDWMDEYSRVR